MRKFVLSAIFLKLPIYEKLSFIAKDQEILLYTGKLLNKRLNKKLNIKPKNEKNISEMGSTRG